MARRKAEAGASELLFLGTAGARIVVFNQILASGGMVLTSKGTSILIDPGPGCLVQCKRHKVSPKRLSAILLSHKHLDHSADVNVMVEAMTDGGFSPRGKLLAPHDALEGDDPVVLKYLRGYLAEGVEVLEPGKTYYVGDIRFETSPFYHKHGEVQTLGLKFHLPEGTLAYVTDGRYAPEFERFYKADVIVMNTVRKEPTPELDHLSAEDAAKLAQAVKPKALILTHFGMTMLRAGTRKVAEELSKRTGVKVIAAWDGARFDIAELVGGATGGQKSLLE